MSKRICRFSIAVRVGEAHETAAEGAAELCFDLADVGVAAAPFQQGAHVAGRQPAPGNSKTAKEGQKEPAGSPHGPAEFRVRGLLDLGGSFGGGDALHGAGQPMAGS